VSERPGTTRDTIEEVINLRGIPLRLVDTAGLRESPDEIEREGIERTRAQVERADLTLRVFDASAEEHEDTKTQREILILNKVDVGEHASWRGAEGVRISCKTGAGMEELAEEIFRRVMGGGAAVGDASVAINARHQACLKSAAQFCEAARKAIVDRLSAEFIAIELRAALDTVGEVVGKADSEELLGKIFSTFCIGK
jgi:tRNA modification GTPase